MRQQGGRKWGCGTCYMRCWLRLLWCSQSCCHTLNPTSCYILKILFITYIVLQMVRANCCASYSKQPCVIYKANMWCLCCMMLFALKFSTEFFPVLWSILWLCHHVVTDVTAWPINPNLSCSKNRKWKMKKKIK